MSFAGPSAHRCLCFGEEDGPNGSYYPCPPELCEADAILERAEAAEAEVERYREGLREIAQYRYPLNEMLDAIIAIKKIARALLADSPDGGTYDDTIIEPIQKRGGYQPTGPVRPRPPDGGGAGVHSADPTQVMPEMMRDAGRGATAGDGAK